MRIAIVRLSSLGDVVHTLPVASAIRRHDPHAQIRWIVEEHEQVLLRGNPVVDEVVVAPLRRWRSLLARGRLAALAGELRRFARQVRAGRVDVTIDVQGWVHKTSPLVALTRAPVRIGFSREHARDRWSPLFTNCHVVPDPSSHVVDQNLALLRPLGIERPPVIWSLPPWPGAAERAERWLAAHGLAGSPPVVLLPSTRGRRKQWPPRRYAELARRLAAAGRLVVMAGGPADGDVFRAIASQEAGLEAYAPPEVGDLAALLARAALVVGNDTGPLHLAAAAGVPTIGLFGPTSGRRNGPYGPNGTFIQSPTGRMADIAVDIVAERALRALAGELQGQTLVR